MRLYASHYLVCFPNMSSGSAIKLPKKIHVENNPKGCVNMAALTTNKEDEETRQLHKKMEMKERGVMMELKKRRGEVKVEMKDSDEK